MAQQPVPFAVSSATAARSRKPVRSYQGQGARL